MISPFTSPTSPERRVLFSELERNTEYQFRIQALNVNGSSPATQWQFAKTFMHDLDGEFLFSQGDCTQSYWLDSLSLEESDRTEHYTILCNVLTKEEYYFEVQ